MQNGYHTAKVEWIKDEPIPPEELGNMLFSLISDIIGNNYIYCRYSLATTINSNDNNNNNNTGLSAVKGRLDLV